MIPVFWLAKEGTTCARCRWDEQYVEDLVSGWLKRPDSWWPEIDHREVRSLPRVDFAVVSFPAGAHADDDVAWLNRELANIHEVILFITSDEASRFPFQSIRHPRMRLWVMEPRPEHDYPEGTEFIGCGSARAGTLLDPPYQRVTPLWFVGQVNHVRREQMIASSASWPEGSVCDKTDGFLEGMPREDYLDDMAQARIVACPSGVQSQDSFRLHEALDLGCVPLADAYRPDFDGRGYWGMVMPGHPFPLIHDWVGDVPSAVKWVEDEYPWINITCHAWWHEFRRAMARRLRAQMPYLPDSPNMTVVIPTSPIPSHPSTEIIRETIDSIRSRTDAEILIMCDGVRPEQWKRRPDYGAYLQRLCSLAEQHRNVTPVWYRKFLHQAEMLSRTLKLVDTQYVLYVEHDTPLVGDIDFRRVMNVMDEWGLNCMRFYHEVAIHPEHAHLMIPGEEFSFVRTMQWSQRPHLALTGWYRHILGEYFDPSARTMIEDVMVGPLEHDHIMFGEDGWDNWRMAIWTPDLNIKRSTHLDGRGGEPKFDMKFRYPGGKPPPGAPRVNQGSS